MRPIHPGEILREEFLLPLGMSAYALSQAIHVPATRVNDIVNAKRGITTDTALRLAATSAITRARAGISRAGTISVRPNARRPREWTERVRVRGQP